LNRVANRPQVVKGAQVTGILDSQFTLPVTEEKRLMVNDLSVTGSLRTRLVVNPASGGLVSRPVRDDRRPRSSQSREAHIGAGH
jgi:hypothetical protein